MAAKKHKMNLSYIFASTALLVSILSFLYLRAYTKKRTTLERIPEDVRREVQEIINDIDRHTDRDSLLVEERIKQFKNTMQDCEKKINMIITDADRRIGVLSREVESRARREDVYAELGRRSGVRTPAPAPVPAQEIVYEAEQESPPTSIGEPDNKTTGEAPEIELTQKEKILRMSSAGFSAAQIAAKLAMNVSTVEMMLYVSEK
jgi:ATP/maltotriose-dependent transcriptional regulator MalT